ncbi:hypothetical protein LSTR_LSTR010563 [Laodelphax striatellus]|uniref:Lipid-binding serum glycoprotein N-terminal domain-containing protein n=1 Tax=Laodelphax striatellus TaxID=195883 RepID=A0A482XIL8_LAOST|nr:hypothetical protein LSTR_LSTR010563 [Laodelphax striatellus]
MIGLYCFCFYFLVLLSYGTFGQGFPPYTTSKPRVRCQLLRTSIDQLLSHTSDSIRDNGLDSIHVNNLTKTIERLRSGTAEVHGSEGTLTDLSTMRLQGEPRFNTNSTVGFHVTIDKLRIVYNNYDQQFDGVRQVGKMTIKVRVNALYVEVKSFSKLKGCGDEVLSVYPKRFARLIFEYEDKSAISFSMMGSRDWPWIKPSDVHEVIFPLVNDVVNKSINSALKRYKFCEHRPSSICT